MTRSELWAKFVERNPSFDGDGNVTLSARGLRKIFDQAWDRGETYGRETAQRTARETLPRDPLFRDIFGPIFGDRAP